MQDNTLFNPERISMAEFKMIKGQVETPENFDIGSISGHQIDNAFNLSFNLNDKLAKADFSVNIKTESRNESEAIGNFHLIFIYKVENLEALTQTAKNKRLKLNPALANSLAAITYSTARGILLSRLQGTALQNFILPIINTNKLLQIEKD